MIIAVDFDGTIVEHKYPAIGKEIPFAFETLRKLQTEHHKLILWSVREGKLLDEAVTFCRERGLEFYAVNRDYPEEEKNLNNHFSRKLKADIFIDDRNLGGLPIRSNPTSLSMKSRRYQKPPGNSIDYGYPGVSLPCVRIYRKYWSYSTKTTISKM